MPKRTTTKKTTNEVSVSAKSEAGTSITVDSKKKIDTYSNDTPIPCRSVTVGELFMVGKKTGELYRWGGYGDTTEVEYQDLKAARLVKSALIFAPNFIIEDSDVVDAWNDVKSVYDNAISDADIEMLYTMEAGKLKRELEKLPDGLKNTVSKLAVDAVRKGKFDSLRAMKVFDDVLGTDLQLQVS